MKGFIKIDVSFSLGTEKKRVDQYKLVAQKSNGEFRRSFFWE